QTAVQQGDSIFPGIHRCQAQPNQNRPQIGTSDSPSAFQPSNRNTGVSRGPRWRHGFHPADSTRSPQNSDDVMCAYVIAVETYMKAIGATSRLSADLCQNSHSEQSKKSLLGEDGG